MDINTNEFSENKHICIILSLIGFYYTPSSFYLLFKEFEALLFFFYIVKNLNIY